LKATGGAGATACSGLRSDRHGLVLLVMVLLMLLVLLVMVLLM
jgi:hypothetical protein